MLFLFIALFLGQPIYLTLILCTIVLMGYSSGTIGGLMAVGTMLFRYCTSYDFSVVPLFVLMGYFVLVGGIGERAFWACCQMGRDTSGEDWAYASYRRLHRSSCL